MQSVYVWESLLRHSLRLQVLTERRNRNRYVRLSRNLASAKSGNGRSPLQPCHNSYTLRMLAGARPSPAGLMKG